VIIVILKNIASKNWGRNTGYWLFYKWFRGMGSGILIDKMQDSQEVVNLII
jgi:hypothetical protein